MGGQMAKCWYELQYENQTTITKFAAEDRKDLVELRYINENINKVFPVEKWQGNAVNVVNV